MTQVDVNMVWPAGVGKVSSKTEGKIYPWTKLEDICRYKTSYQIAHQYRLSPDLMFERAKAEECKELVENDLTLNNWNYQTTYNKHFNLKYNEEDVMNKADLPGFRTFKFMKTVNDKMKFVPKRQIVTASEYKEKYPGYLGKEPVNGELKDFSPKTNCKIVGLTRDDQPKIPLEIECAGKYMDPYVSQCHMDYTYKSPFNVEKLNYMPPDYLKSVFPKAPSPGERAQSDAFLYRNLGKRLVPMISLTKEHYRREMLQADPRSPYPVYNLRQTKGDVLRTPAMYHTEYSHIGNNWHTDILVDHV
uniref:Uncharacterized protein n=1 Tax=Lygus hesperus TaxID=30085 RepID=A0A0A9VZR7_LYGHE